MKLKSLNVVLCFRVFVCLLVWKFSILLSVSSIFKFQDLTQKKQESFQAFLVYIWVLTSQTTNRRLCSFLQCFSFFHQISLGKKKKKNLKYFFIIFPQVQFLINIGWKTQYLFSSIPKKVRRCTYVGPSSF